MRPGGRGPRPTEQGPTAYEAHLRDEAAKSFSTTISFGDWAAALPRWLLRSRTPFAAYLAMTFRSPASRCGLAPATATFPLPCPRLGLFGRCAHGLPHAQKQRLYLHRVVHIVVAALNMIVAGGPRGIFCGGSRMRPKRRVSGAFAPLLLRAFPGRRSSHSRRVVPDQTWSLVFWSLKLLPVPLGLWALAAPRTSLPTLALSLACRPLLSFPNYNHTGLWTCLGSASMAPALGILLLSLRVRFGCRFKSRTSSATAFLWERRTCLILRRKMPKSI